VIQARRAGDGVLGAVLGDIVGSLHESRWQKVDDRAFALFSAASHPTDDSVLTLAVAEAVRLGADFASTIQRWANAYPYAGYGGMFKQWMRSDHPKPYGSFGNGSAMRVSAVACASDDDAVVLDLAARSAAVTHDDPEGIKGAQAVALAILVARRGGGLPAVRATVEGFGYDLSRSVDEWRGVSAFDVTCQGTVPPAVQAVLESESLESAIRNAVFVGGDADTLAAIAGSIGAAAFGIPPHLRDEAVRRLDPTMREALADFESWLDARVWP
jgi:ADP-ribosylglycohydrolase